MVVVVSFFFVNHIPQIKNKKIFTNDMRKWERMIPVALMICVNGKE